MIKIAIYKKDDGALLVIWKTPKENLIGELYHGGEYHRGEWDNRATFNANEGDATEYRVKEYFGFSTSNSIAYWKRWA